MLGRSYLFAFCLGLAIWAISCRQGSADIILSIQDVNVAPGGSAYVGFLAQSASGFAISGFNLPTDINNDRLNALPPGFTLNAIAIQNAIYTNTIFDTPPSIVPARVDGIITGNGIDEALLGVPRKLFDLVIDVANDVPIGTRVPISLVIPGDGLESLFAVSGPNNPPVVSPTNGNAVVGYITIVPEPSIFVVPCFSVLGLIVRRRRVSSIG